jgi:ribonuclease BN (tRNA processing enzyme)
VSAGLPDAVTVTFAGSGDAFGSGGRLQACIHLGCGDRPAVLLDCGATSLSALRRCELDPGRVAAVLVSHLHGDHFAGLPFLILDGQFSHRADPLTVIGPRGTEERLRTAMECMFPGSATVRRRYPVHVVELDPGCTAQVADLAVTAWAVDHPSGAPALALRLVMNGKTVAYTGDTAWTDALIDVAAGADLLIAEAYYRDKAVPYHLRLRDIDEHRAALTSRRIVLTHMSADLLAHVEHLGYECAADGLVLRI